MDYKTKKVTTIRADKFKSWKNNRTNQQEVTQAIMDHLEDYDCLIGHNAQWFDKKFLNALCLKYHIDPALRNKKMIDPVLLSRRHLQLSGNSLAYLIEFLNVSEKKTPIQWKHWMLAAFEGNSHSMDYISTHCVADVKSLYSVYEKLRKLVGTIDNKGSQN